MTTTKAATTPSAGERTQASSTTPATPMRAGFAQALGNQNLQMLLRARVLQAKLTVSHPQDLYEQEADRVADQVMRMPEAAPRVTHAAPAVQRSTDTAANVPTVDAALEHSINALSGRGSALPESTRSFMEPRFNADFSAVRVHTDAHAHELARSVNAQAFTVGRNVVFGAGRYAPETESGKRLLAHELTHVVQQSSAGPRKDDSISRTPAPALARAVEDVFNGPVTAVDQWLKGPVDVAGLSNTQLQDQIDELEQYLNRQTGSSPKATRLEEALVLLRNQLDKQNKAAQPPAHAPRGRAKRPKAKADAVPRPARYPRILSEKSSVAYANPADLRAEYDLIMQWLAVKDLPAKDRQILLAERTMLAPQLQSDRQRVIAERHVARARAALTPTDSSSAAAALLSVAQIVDGIAKDPDNDGVAYMYHQGERIAISAEQAAGLRKGMAYELEHAAMRIMSDAATELERYHTTIARNEKDWLEARGAELVQGKLWGFDDPLKAMHARFPRIAEGLKEVRAHLKAGRLSEAAAVVPRIEVLGKEMAKVSRAFEKHYIEGAERAITVLEITVKAAAAIELSLIAAAATPFVAGHVAGFVGAEGLGLTGITGTAVTTLGTAAGTGTAVGLGNAALRGGTALGVSLATGHSLADAWQASKGDAVQGFKDGFLAGATGGAARIVAPALGVGANLSYQAARRAGAEAIVNGTSTMVQALASGKSLKDAIAEGTASALLSIPGAVIGGGATDVKRLIAGSLAASGAAYGRARVSGLSADQALEQASIALITHVAATTTVKHGAADTAALTRGRNAGKAVRNTAIKAVAAVAIGTAKVAPGPGGGGPRIVVHDETAHSVRAADKPPTPTPDPVESTAVPARPTAQAAADSEPEARPQPRLSEGSTGAGTKPFSMDEQDLQHRAAEALRRPVKDLYGQVHFYKTRAEFEGEYLRKFPNGKPPRGYFETDTGDIHISPDADVETALHEVGHKVRDLDNRFGPAYIGDFLEEGVVDAAARGRTAGGLNTSAYKKNVAFYHLLKRTLGPRVVDDALLRGEYAPFRAKIRALFDGSELRTFEFFNKLRSIGARAQNQQALDDAVAMLEEATGRGASQSSATTAPQTPIPNSPLARIEKAGPFSFLCVTEVEQQVTGRVLSRRIASVLRSGGPMAKTDLGPLLDHLIADAKVAGAARLRVFPEFIDHPDVGSIRTLAEAFGGTLHDVDSRIEIDLPVVNDMVSAGSGPVRGGVGPSANKPTSAPRPKGAPALPSARSAGPLHSDPSDGDFDDTPTIVDLPRLPAIIFKGEGLLENGEVDPDRVILVLGDQPIYLSSSTGRTYSGDPTAPVKRILNEAYAFHGLQEGTSAFGPEGWVIKFTPESQIPIVPGGFHNTYTYTIEGTLATAKEVNAWLRSRGARVVTHPFAVRERIRIPPR